MCSKKETENYTFIAIQLDFPLSFLNVKIPVRSKQATTKSGGLSFFVSIYIIWV